MAAATPEVPNETETSPTLMPSPRDAMALSPPPGAMMQPPSTFLPAISGLALTAAASCGPSTVGSMIALACSRAASVPSAGSSTMAIRSRRYSLEAAS